ncbi:MAG TPA: DUF4837 family protein [Bacteroidales bacterium]|jgi:hypothetical protein|nr:hypothetical protein [Bacteroidota bacterium]HJN06886.1 DUF4837 family protein [Bacteroidales bacterium]|tara:strand:+ start:378 stop:1388 length:1011 start_codon:yes stop_codon:yes gene_type:complete
MKLSGLQMCFVVAMMIFTVASCDSNKNRSNLPRSIGNTSEVLVVLQNEQQWDNMIGQAIKKFIGQEQYGLAQAEPIFDLAHITKNNFSDMFKKHRNILIVNINKKDTAVKVESFKDRWASPQRIIRITSNSASQFAAKFPDYAENIIRNYNMAERSRILSVFRPSSKNKVLNKVRKSFNLDIIVPQGFYVAKTAAGFMWIRKEVTDFSQGIIIMSEPYADKEQFSKNSIAARTNRYLKQYIPGDSEGSYMVIDDEFISPITSPIENFISEYTVEMRGVWSVEHDFMGGPFISYTFVDPRNNQILTLMGYVYHPNKKKRNLLRQLEAIIYSVKSRNL